MTLLQKLWNGLYRKCPRDDWEPPEIFYEEFENEHGDYELFVGSVKRVWHRDRTKGLYSPLTYLVHGRSKETKRTSSV